MDDIKLTPAEAVYGVLAWLSTIPDHDRRLDAVVEPNRAAYAAQRFCEANGLGEPRETWPGGLVHPAEDVPTLTSESG